MFSQETIAAGASILEEDYSVLNLKMLEPPLHLKASNVCTSSASYTG